MKEPTRARIEVRVLREARRFTWFAFVEPRGGYPPSANADTNREGAAKRSGVRHTLARADTWKRGASDEARALGRSAKKRDHFPRGEYRQEKADDSDAIPWQGSGSSAKPQHAEAAGGGT